MARLILFVSTIFSMIWITYRIIIWVYIYCNYPLSYIIVTGNYYLTTARDIQSVIAQLKTLGTFITQDISVVQNCIEQLPWIKQVSVRKQWPDTLKIHLVEYIPKAYWNDDLVISTEGVIFRIYKNQINDNNIDIPVLYGPEDKARDVLYNYLVFEEILKSSKFQIRSVKMDDCYSLQLVLGNNICLRLGRNNMVDRLLYFIKIYPILFKKMSEQNKYIDYIDLRYRSGYPCRYKMDG